MYNINFFDNNTEEQKIIFSIYEFLSKANSKYIRQNSTLESGVADCCVLILPN